jgi:hypothetical protein
MRRNLAAAIGLIAAIALGGATIAAATSTTVHAGDLVLTFGSNVVPKKLPRKELAPIALNVSGKIRTTDGTHPSAFREAIVDIDKNGQIDTRGVPVCKGSQLQARDTKAAKRVCGKALVGSGSAHVDIAFPEQPSIRVASPLLIFNGGTRGNRTTMYIHSFITVPVPAAIVTTLTIKKVHEGRFGYQTVAKIPQIVGGSGSAVDFKFTIEKKFFRYRHGKHSLLSAKCPDGHFKAKVLKALFRNEARVAGVPAQTVLKSSLVVPCTPKG